MGWVIKQDRKLCRLQAWAVGGVRRSLTLQRLRGQPEGWRAGDGVPTDAVHGLEASDQRSQERCGQCLWAQVPGLRTVGGQGLGGQMCGGPQGAGRLQGTYSATHTPLGRAQHGAGGGETQALPAGLEGVLRDGANAQGLAKAGRMVAPPNAGDPVAALKTVKDDLPGTQSDGGQ